MPFVIPVFIPHEGCPYNCVFCNQRRISGRRGERVTPREVADLIGRWLELRKNNTGSVQVAFYGGSFTALAPARRQELLAAVHPFIKEGRVQTIRLSTRPDCIDPSGLELLLNNHVATVELGVQSMDERVLAASGRGHGAGEVRRSVPLLRDFGMEVGIQLMLGLPGESRLGLRRTVEETIRLRPDFVRIYPVVVVKNSGLAELYARGEYRPLSLDKAVLLAAWMKRRFDRAGIRVVRMGLQAGEELEGSIIAGPWHPAFGELVLSRLMLQRTRQLLATNPSRGPVCLKINNRDQSIFRGMKSTNIKRLEQLGLWQQVVLKTDGSLPRQTVLLSHNP